MDSMPKMDLENEIFFHASVEDNEEITNGSVSENLKNIAESSSYNNGSVVVENGDDNDELLPDWKQKGPEVLASVNSSPEQSSSVVRAKKGIGLRKWRRIRRDPNKVGDNSIDGDKMAVQDLGVSGVNPSKRMLLNGEQPNQRSEGSVSSTNAVIGRLSSFTPLDDSKFGLGFAPGTDSESSEHQSSRSSTAASAPKKKHETGAVSEGFPRDKNRMRSSSGKNLMNTVPRGQQGRFRGEQVKVEKETSRSSIESDSRSSNFVFLRTTFSVSNGMRNGIPKNSEGEKGDEAEGSQQVVSDGRGGDYGSDVRGEYDDLSPEDVVADSRDHDILVESIFHLQSAQDALEKEVLKFKDVSKDISVDGSVSDIDTEFLSVELKDHFPQSIVVGEVEAELEDLFKQKIEAELEYLVISRSIQTLKVKFTVLEEQRALAAEQTDLLDRLGNTENKVVMLRSEAEKLQNVCEDIARTGEILTLQNSAWKYGLCFFVQLLLLIAIITAFIYRAPQNHALPAPT